MPRFRITWEQSDVFVAEVNASTEEKAMEILAQSNYSIGDKVNDAGGLVEGSETIEPICDVCDEVEDECCCELCDDCGEKQPDCLCN